MTIIYKQSSSHPIPSSKTLLLFSMTIRLSEHHPIPSHPRPSTSPRSHRFCPSPPWRPRSPAPAPAASTPCKWARCAGRSWPARRRLGGENPWENQVNWTFHIYMYQLMVGFCWERFVNSTIWWFWWYFIDEQIRGKKWKKKHVFVSFLQQLRKRQGRQRTMANLAAAQVETGVQCNWSPDSSEKPHGQYHPQILVVNPSCSLHFSKPYSFSLETHIYLHICLQNFPIQPHLLQLPKFS